MTSKVLVSGLLMMHLCSSLAAPPVTGQQPERWRLMVSPVIGFNENTVVRRSSQGRGIEQSDTAAQYGLFLLASRGWLTLTDYLFWTDVNESEVGGNLFFANVYGRRDEPWGWNIGAGHLYHWIDTPAGEITVDAPMLKVGPVWRHPAAGISINPYAGYVWETVETPRSREREGAMLYGLTLGWRKRGTSVSLKYYYQRSTGNDEADYHTLRTHLNWQFSQSWGGVLRFDYMEHVTSDDISLMAGPVYRF